MTRTIHLMPVGCEKQLEGCELVLEAADKTIRVQNDLIVKQSDQIEDLKFSYNIVKAELQERQEELSAWYRNPAIVIPLSFVAGAVVFSQIGK